MFPLGLTLLACCLSSHVHSCTVRSNTQEQLHKNFTSRYQHCARRPDGVQHLQCFGKPNKPNMMKTCAWTPGKHTSQKTYMLILQQDNNYSMAYANITASSQVICIHTKYNMVVNVYENAESATCTRAVLSAAPQSLVNFRRQHGSLHVSVSWQQADVKAIFRYSVRYKVQGSQFWTEPAVQSHNRQTCTVDNLNPSLFYAVEIQCVTNKKCSQCPWSHTYTVPSELTAPPVLVDLKDDVIEQEGSRRISLQWKFPASQSRDGFFVTVAKATGEAPRERMWTARPEIRLILSYSSYNLSISAANNVSESPAVSHMVPQRGEADDQGKLNVTVHSDRSLTVHWRHNLVRTYVCFSVEWRTEGHKPMSKSFYEKVNNWRTLPSLSEPLEPYKRYSMTLHTRPDKNTCNLKSINKSESTYGSTQFYYLQGAPVGAPNISVYNLTLDSVVLHWMSVPQNQTRGFLQGYVIYYSKQRGASAESKVSVAPDSHTYELKELEGGTTYQVQLAAVTQAGAGVRSLACIFKTHYKGYFISNQNGLIILFAVMAAVLISASLIIKRLKDILWPSIPNPGKSNAMQKIGEPCEMELLESIDHLKAESANSLQIVEKEAARPLVTLQSLTIHDSGDESAEMSESVCAAADMEPTTSHMQSSPCAFQSGYTTVEMFQQGVVPAAPAVARCHPQDAATSGLDHDGPLGSGSDVDGETYTVF